MKLRSNTGGVVEISADRADRLLKSGFFQELDAKAPEAAAEAPETQTEGDDTPEPVEVTPEPSEPQEDDKPEAKVVRAWAVENNVEVPAKGRVPETVYEQYAEAHKN